MPVINHTHKYSYKNIGTKAKPRKVYGCALPDCSHFMPTNDQVLNKSTICWQCEEKMLMSKDIVNKTKPMVKPRCLRCRGKLPKEDSKKASIDRAVDMLFALRS